MLGESFLLSASTLVSLPSFESFNVQTGPLSSVSSSSEYGTATATPTIHVFATLRVAPL